MSEESRVWEHVQPRDDEQPTPPPAAVNSVALMAQALELREQGKTFEAITAILEAVALAQHEPGTHDRESVEWAGELLRAWYPKVRKRRGRR